MPPSYRTLTLIGVSALYTVAFFLPAANPYFDPVDPELRPWPGHTVFRLGWRLLTHWESGDPFVGLQVEAVTGWMANPAIFLALIAACLRRWWWVRLFGGIGTILALSLLIAPKLADAFAGQIGFWAWAGSAMILCIVGWGARRSAVRTAAK